MQKIGSTAVILFYALPGFAKEYHALIRTSDTCDESVFNLKNHLVTTDLLGKVVISSQ